MTAPVSQAEQSNAASPLPRVFDSVTSPADPKLLASLEASVRGADLIAPPVVLPDFLHKRDMELPSSIAVATRGTIRSTFTSSSINCGMALVALDMERPDGPAVADYFRKIRERYPWPAGRRRLLNADDVVDCAQKGAEFAVERYGLDPSGLERIEAQGRLDTDRWGGRDRVRRELPWMTRQLARLRFGTIGPSNHFIELQEVEEVYDEVAAARLGVRAGQMTVQYHGGGGVLAGQVGRLFGRRMKTSKFVRTQMAVQKPLYHLARAGSLEEARLRRTLYFAEGVPVPRFGPEGERFMLANAAAMNYGFAFRAATYAALTRLANESFGPTKSSLIVDSPHNSIYEEDVDGESAIVHRHNSARAFPASLMPQGSAFGEVGQAILIPGTHQSSSYLCVAEEGSAKSMHSSCHGAGSLVSDFVKRGLSGPDPQGRSTRRFRYTDEAPADAPHFDDRGVNEAVSILVKAGVCRPVARMRPMAVLH